MNPAEAVFPHELVARRGHETPLGLARRVHDVRTFRRILDHERARADCSNQTFSVVTFEDRELNCDESQITCDLLSPNLREIDEIGRFSAGVLAVLLPYASSSDAWKLADDLVATYPLRGTPPVCDVLVYPSHWPAPPIPPDADDEATSPRRPAGQLEPLFAQRLPVWKRLIDVLGSAVGLFILAPLLLVVACAIKLTSQGPVFFMQFRTGLGGRRFRIVKFRTMRCNAEKQRQELLSYNEQDGPAFKITNDPRVTPIGRLLRITSIDELPQLWNVLKGEMSLVGPRPLPCAEAEACAVWQRRRHDVTPGITCFWQAFGRSRTSFSEWMRLDLDYIAQRSLWTDLKLLVITIPTVLLNRKDC